jgi:hypothetical protein
MIKLLNLEEYAPSEFFIFVNQNNPVTYHNFNLTGRFGSGAFQSISFSKETLEKYISGRLQFLPYRLSKMDAVAVSPYFLSAINDYRIEHDVEIYREQHYPIYPSRLSAIYAFRDYETCIAVHKKHNWNLSQVQRFRLVEHPLNRVVKVNMEHVSLARHAYKVSRFTDIERLCQGYWQGFDNIILELPTENFQRRNFESGVIWEYLIEGVVEKIELQLPVAKDAV